MRSPTRSYTIRDGQRQKTYTFGSEIKRNYTIRLKTKALISFEVTVKLICALVFEYAKHLFLITRPVLYRGGRATEWAHLDFNGVVWMSNVNCTGTETDLVDCPFLGWADYTCWWPSWSHAGVFCDGKCHVVEFYTLLSEQSFRNCIFRTLTK